MLRVLFAIVFWTVVIGLILGIILVFGLPLIVTTIGVAAALAIGAVALFLLLIFIVFIIG